jgi:CelD/BcsL family acetyltransferase involved in cellulose biosynthesis
MAHCSAALMVDPVSIDFTVGSRRLAGVPRKVNTWSFSLEDVIAADLAAAIAKAPACGPDGLRVLSAPTAALPDIFAHFPGLVAGARQDYRRHYIDMSLGYDGYMARFSGKTRSTLRRKAKKLAEEVGGYAVSEYRSPAEVERFLEAALPLSERTYQARLLDAGLPNDPASRAAMLQSAKADRMRCFLLEARGEPLAYLSLPVAGDTLIYAHLGYHPAFSRLSPGTVLQMEALERLFAEGRYRWFDFTEGEGAHKELFGTHNIACSSLILLRASLANRALLNARSGFDTIVAEGKHLAARSGALAQIRSLLRA